MNTFWNFISEGVFLFFLYNKIFNNYASNESK